MYVSRDVVFYEKVFPFASLCPNAGSRLRQDILLLPHDSSISHVGDAKVDDLMTVPIIHVATNAP